MSRTSECCRNNFEAVFSIVSEKSQIQKFFPGTDTKISEFIFIEGFEKLFVLYGPSDFVGLFLRPLSALTGAAGGTAAQIPQLRIQPRPDHSSFNNLLPV